MNETGPAYRVHRRPGRTITCLVILTVLFVPAIHQPTANARLGVSSSLEGSGGLVRVRTAELQTRGVLALSLGGDYYESADLMDALDSQIGRYSSLHVAGNYGVATWLELSLDLPLRNVAWDSDAGQITATGLSNPRLAVKLGAPWGGDVWRAALEVGARLPVGREICAESASGCAAHLTGGRPADGDAVFLLTADFTESFPIRLHANVGWAFQRDEERGHRFYPDYYPPSSGSDTDNDALLLRGAIEFPGRSVDLFTEFRGDLLSARDLVALKENQLTVTPGLRIRFADSWEATAAVAIAISGDDRDTPDFDPHDAYPDWEASLALSVAWPLVSADTDGDGIPDLSDRCVRAAEDFDGFRDEDGCPDFDNDGDGIEDSIDGAPGAAEDFDGFEDDDGVPDLDNDGDGIVDERDMCPDEAEDLDGFEDQDGCPDR